MSPTATYNNSKLEHPSCIWLATCPKGVESLLVDELTNLGAQDVKASVASVRCQGPLELGYRVCLWSRLTSRLLLQLSHYEVTDAESLYAGALLVPWEVHLGADNSLRIDFTGTSREISHSHYGAQRVKDAIVDRMREQTGARPNIELQNPDLRLQARLHKGKVSIAIEFSGGSLQHRGYCVDQSKHRLNENLAAALLMRAGWPEICTSGGAFLDPFCGNGTLLIEAAMMAYGLAPGRLRPEQSYGFHHWLGHQPQLWSHLFAEAGALPATKNVILHGYEGNPKRLAIARQQVERAQLEAEVVLEHKPIAQFGKPTAEHGLLMSALPLVTDIWEAQPHEKQLTHLGQILQKNFKQWRAALFSANPDDMRALDPSPSKQYKFELAQQPCRLLLFDDLRSKSAQIAQRLEQAPPAPVLSEGAQMLLNRLQKNQKRYKNWLKQTDIRCYRLYDADIPEYAVAIDCYGDALHVQEYKAPPSVDAAVARQRFQEVRQAMRALAPNASIFYKERQRQKGSAQYHRQGSQGQALIVQEGPARLEVNLSDYLDTGLFLDHRPVRTLIRAQAKGARFLNLFCYTAAVTVHAALGGARSSLSIDMSNTYLDWAQRNFTLNQINSHTHRLQRADCLEWLQTAKGEYDLIFLDPPTFSNSKKMQEVLDVQRDHADMIHNTMRLLAPRGQLFFSNNFRKFKMSPEVLARYQVQEITAQTLDPDFARNPRIHNVWRIQYQV